MKDNYITGGCYFPNGVHLKSSSTIHYHQHCTIMLTVTFQVLGFDPHLAIQAHGILGDLMLDGSLPNGVVQKLNSVQQLLAPRVTRNVPVAQHLVRTSIQHDRIDHEMSLHSQSSGSSHGGSLKRNSFLVRCDHVMFSGVQQIC